MENQETETFICSQQKIEIPEEFRTIAVRSNYGKQSPFEVSSKTPITWPESGGISSKERRGLFGVLISQNFDYLESVSFFYPLPRFLILEVDKRKLLTTATLDPNTEVEFKSCNVLFNGFIEDFFEKIKEYATDEQLQKLHYSLDWKYAEIQEGKQSAHFFMILISRVLLRVKEAKRSNNIPLRLTQMIEGLKKENTKHY